MKKPLAALFAVILLAAAVACSDSTDLASGNTVVTITWTNSGSPSSHACYLAIVKGNYPSDLSSLPPSGDIVYNKSVSSSVTKKYVNLADGSYTAYIYFDNNDDGTVSMNDMPSSSRQFTATGGAAVALTGQY